MGGLSLSRGKHVAFLENWTEVATEYYGPTHGGDSTLQCVAMAEPWLVLGLRFLFCERVEFSLKNKQQKRKPGGLPLGCEGQYWPGLVTPEWAAFLSAS